MSSELEPATAILELFPAQGEWRDSDYWIVDPRDESIVVLSLRDGVYVAVNQQAACVVAESNLLPGFKVDVQPLFEAARSV